MSGAAGTPLRVALAGLPDPGAVGIVTGAGADRVDVVVVRAGGRVRAYLNSCPHKGTPLETVPGCFLDEAASLLVCSTHGARFRLDDGRCVAGPCVGHSLRALRADVRDGYVFVSADRDD